MNYPDEAGPSRNHEQALERWRTLGRLGVTAQDHLDIGGSPPIKLNGAWGKTQAEIMSDEEIREYLRRLKASLEHGREKFKADRQDYLAREEIIDAKKNLRLDLAYLKSIRRLPPEFNHYSLEDSAEDPQDI